jgi:hypothetical protein
MDTVDLMIWCAFMLALALVALGLDRLYEWFVEPSRYHTPGPAALPSDPYPDQER